MPHVPAGKPLRLGDLASAVCSRRGAIILAGGKSSRMGSPKAALDWHGSTLLRRVTGLAQRTVDGPVVVVRAPEQELPELHSIGRDWCQTRARGAGRCRASPPDWRRSATAPRSPSCPPPTCRCCTRRSSAASSTPSPPTSTSCCPRSTAFASRCRRPIARASCPRSKHWSPPTSSSRRSCSNAAGCCGSTTRRCCSDATAGRRRSRPGLGPQPQRARATTTRPTRCPRPRSRSSRFGTLAHQRRAARPARGGLDPGRARRRHRAGPGRARGRRAQRRPDHPGSPSCRWRPGTRSGFMVADAGG